ncbi:type II toxin-antitoxin system RelE/ParE family toxin [Sphingobium estronivorans]|uniref:type II toxin-antitoxin system RelE/ParE family toxin n=1 Tax=Sphingobium estronivorans TaxID=1577690 RepID=UPI001F08179A|nr:type II toxin-antitoxin system RelE/ParE family toxin [Sphingobium estronivorans]
MNYIAVHPESGVSLGDGLRKVLIPREGGGKSGGYRTIYLFGGSEMPIYLVTVFAKNEKDNLSKAEQAAAVELAKALVATYGDRR